MAVTDPHRRTTVVTEIQHPSGGQFFWYFEGVTVERAHELTEYHIAAQCMSEDAGYRINSVTEVP